MSLGTRPLATIPLATLPAAGGAPPPTILTPYFYQFIAAIGGMAGPSG